MKNSTLCGFLTLSVSLLVVSINAGPPSSPEAALVSALRKKPLLVPESEAAEIKKRAAIYNELLSEMEERAIAFAAGTETEAGLFDVMGRVYKAALETTPGASRGKLRFDLLSTLAKQAEEVRKIMHTRLQNKKGNAAQARADLHRAKAFCLEIELELARVEGLSLPPRPPRQ